MFTEKTIDRESQQKLYVQVYSVILSNIEKGVWPTGTQIPTEDELCKIYDVSKATVRMAISELVRKGFLKRQQGRGTFVSSTIPSGFTMKYIFSEDMPGTGPAARKKLLSAVVMDAPAQAERVLELGANTKVFYLSGAGYIGGDPVVFSESYIPLFVMPDLEKVDHESLEVVPLYNLIQERAFYKIDSAVQTVEVIQITGKAAEVLHVPENFTGLEVTRVVTDIHGRPLAFTQLTGKGNRYKFRMEFERMK